MRALTATIVTTLLISTACVGGPGSPPNPDDDPVDQVQTGGSGERERERPNQDEEPPRSTPPGPPSQPAACVADQCAPVECTCQDVPMSIKRCVEGRCVTTCAEAGCS